jgi:hypothetical protein
MRAYWSKFAQTPPQLALWHRHGAAQLPRARYSHVFAAISSQCPPTPDPSPPLRGGRGNFRTPWHYVLRASWIC